VCVWVCVCALACAYIVRACVRVRDRLNQQGPPAQGSRCVCRVCSCLRAERTLLARRAHANTETRWFQIQCRSPAPPPDPDACPAPPPDQACGEFTPVVHAIFDCNRCDGCLWENLDGEIFSKEKNRKDVCTAGGREIAVGSERERERDRAKERQTGSTVEDGGRVESRMPRSAL